MTRGEKFCSFPYMMSLSKSSVWDFKNGCIYFPSHTAPHLNFSITYKRSVEFQMEIKIICRRGFGSQTTQIVVNSRCCFA